MLQESKIFMLKSSLLQFLPNISKKHFRVMKLRFCIMPCSQCCVMLIVINYQYNFFVYAIKFLWRDNNHSVKICKVIQTSTALNKLKVCDGNDMCAYALTYLLTTCFYALSVPVFLSV